MNAKEINAATRNYLKSLGYTVTKTEWYDSRTRRNHDLLGFIDFLALKPGEILGVQATTFNNRIARVNKIKGEKRAEAKEWLDAGGKIWVIGWKQVDLVRVDAVTIEVTEV